MEQNELKVRLKVGFGLAFDVEETTETNSGYKPALYDLGVGKALYGDLRLLGFASALATGFVSTLVLAGGDEGRYKDREVPVNRAEAIRLMLIHDFGAPPERVRAFASRSNTGGNIAIFKSVMDAEGLHPSDCGLITNLYHLPRACLMAKDLSVLPYAAESLWLLAKPARKNDLIHMLGDGELAERCGDEIAGIADMIRGTYQPRTDTAAVSLEGLSGKPVSA